MARKLHSYTDLGKRISEDGQYRAYYYWDNFANKAVGWGTRPSNSLSGSMILERIYGAPFIWPQTSTEIWIKNETIKDQFHGKVFKTPG
jgi:hypothetical protein